MTDEQDVQWQRGTIDFKEGRAGPYGMVPEVVQELTDDFLSSLRLVHPTMPVSRVDQRPDHLDQETQRQLAGATA